MPCKTKHFFFLCCFLFSFASTAQEVDQVRKNHFGFGASWQSEIGENANGFGMKVRYERGKGCLRFIATMETENMSYKNSNTTDESTHDNGSGSWRWIKEESHHVNVFSNLYSLGFVLKTQQEEETVRVGMGFNIGYHQKMFRNFKKNHVQ